MSNDRAAAKGRVHCPVHLLLSKDGEMNPRLLRCVLPTVQSRQGRCIGRVQVAGGGRGLKKGCGARDKSRDKAGEQQQGRGVVMVEEGEEEEEEEEEEGFS